MQNARNDYLIGLRFVLVVTILLTLGVFAHPFRYALQMQFMALSWKWKLLLIAGAVALSVEIAILIATWTPLYGTITHWAKKSTSFIERLGVLRYPFLLILWMILPLIVMSPYGDYFQSIFSRALIFWVVLICNVLILASLRPKWSRSNIFLGLTLLQGVLYRIAVFLPDLSRYPFSLGWSEASRYYYASLIFSERIYDMQIGPSVLHPTRYLLQSIPFLVPGSTLWVHRFWQVVLWLGTTIAASYFLTRRVSKTRGWMAALMMAWGFLFFFQGPVYYHLQIMVILVLVGFNRTKHFRSLLVILAASAWAGISRVNWFPVPGLLAALLYFLEGPRDQKPVIRYLTWPVFLVFAGSIGAFLSQSAYVLLSGQVADRFTSSLASQLFWYRLLPNQTYPLGVLPAILLASLPVILLTIEYLRSGSAAMVPLRKLGVLGIILVLFAGGLVVSTKIGGGSNLHNLDAYLVVLAVIGAYSLGGAIKRENDDENHTFDPSLLTKGLLVSIPVLFVLGAGSPMARYDAGQAQNALGIVRTYAQETALDGDEVLFISQRHILTFDMIEDVPLVQEYETVFLMEMAMSGNQAYLDDFQDDLRDGRFGLIIVATLEREYQGRSHAFGEENDAWVREVSEPILCYYTPIKILESPRLQFLVPRAESEWCELAQ